MTNFFSKYKVFFFVINFILIFLYLFPGSFIGSLVYDDKQIQPQITPDFIISSNHFYTFTFISIIGLLSYSKLKQLKFLIFYLVFLSIILEVLHLIIPYRIFEWPDLFGNLFGVIVVLSINNLINKHGIFKK
tara:strand:- start:907 stop:1302 length:396 start_codon:yes stop_codon:yes gene_type:complete